MELGNAIVGAIVIGMCVLPFGVIYFKRKNREKQFSSYLSKIANQKGGQIHQKETFVSFAIGYDESKKFVFYYRQLRNGEVERWVDLKEIQTVRVVNTSRTFSSNGGNQRIIERLELSFIHIAKNNPSINMQFFDADEYGQLSGELQSIEKWAKFFNDQIELKN